MSKSRPSKGKGASLVPVLSRAPGLPMEEAQRGWPEGRSPSGEEPYMRHFSVRQQLFRFFPRRFRRRPGREAKRLSIAARPLTLGSYMAGNFPAARPCLLLFSKNSAAWASKRRAKRRPLPRHGDKSSRRGICRWMSLLSRNRYAARAPQPPGGRIWIGPFESSSAGFRSFFG